MSVVRDDLQVFVGKLLQAFFKRSSFNFGPGKESIRNEPVKRHQVVYEDLQLNLDVIVIDIDFGDIGCILRTRNINPVGLSRRHCHQSESDQQQWNFLKIIHRSGLVLIVLVLDIVSNCEYEDEHDE